MNDQSMLPLLDVAWAAGVFEGEGSMDWKDQERKSDRAYRNGHRGRLRIRVGMTDEDVVRRFQSAVGVGSVSHLDPSDGRKRMFVWYAYGANAAKVLELFRPYLGERRTAKLDSLLALWRP